MTISTAAIGSRGHRHRLAGFVAAAFVLITAQPASAANATNINIQLPAGYTITGTIRDAAGAVLPEAIVTATGTSSYGSADTDATGKYKMIGLKGGSYQIRVIAPYLASLANGYYTTANANHFTASSAASTKVTVGPNKTGIDVKLSAGYTITGTVMTTGGAPLGLPVDAVGPSGANDNPRHGQADATGKFVIGGLAPGSYKVFIYSMGGFPSSYQNGWYTSANANHFVVSAGSATSVTVGPNKTGVNVKVPTGYSIRGKITNASGTPLASVDVLASSATYTGSGSTDASGAYSIHGLAPGAYKLRTLPQQNLVGPNASYKDGYYTSLNADHFTGAATSATTISVGPSRTGVNMKMATGHSISGTITTTSGMPLAHAIVSADNLGHQHLAETDASGKYTIKGLTGGSQTLRISAPHTAPTLQQQGYYTTNNAKHFTVVASNATAVTVGPSKTGVNARIPAGYSIAGRITRSGGIGVAETFVQVSSTNGYGSAYTYPDGTYEITGLPSGIYKIQTGSPYGQNLVAGWYITANSAHYTSNAASASGVTVGP